jgi:hypothetical protein
MILRLAIRSLAMRPLRTAVLAMGFGLGIAVMAELLGVGEVILQQAHSPALAGGGDVVVTGVFGPLDSGRFVLSSVLGAGSIRPRVRAASPSKKATLYLVTPDTAIPVSVRGGIPDREAALGEPEIAGQPWRSTAADNEWVAAPAGVLLRAMDRFHPIPADATRRFAATTWAEWLYFNGRSADGSLRFYLTVLSGGAVDDGKRPIVVRLQLTRGGVVANYSEAAMVDAHQLLERAPDLDVGLNRVRLGDDGRYRIRLALARESRTREQTISRSLTGELVLEPSPGRSLPPAEIHGARGWVSGYVVPVLSGIYSGTLRVNGEDLRVDGAAGYHDHNWGFWEGVSWQWGQLAGSGLSIVYGRVFPPADVADRDRVPGFLGVLGSDGPIGFSTDVTIREDSDEGTPRTITIASHDRRLPLTLAFTVIDAVRTPMALTRGPAGAMTFLQLGGEYRVTGRAGDREVNFTTRGSAETFRQ